MSDLDDRAGLENETFRQGDLADVPISLPSEALPVPADGAGTLPSLPSSDGIPAGRDMATGRFLRGNRCGTGSPLAAKANKLRAAMFRAIDAGDIREIIDAVKVEAKRGNLVAARLILAYTLGEPVALDVVEKIERLEAVYIKGRG
jgi:hypothetical protein